MSSLRLNPYFVCFFYFQYYDVWVIQPHIIETIMLSGRNPHQNKNAGRKRHIPLYGAHKWSICLSNVNIQKFVCFLSIVLMSHSSSYFLERNILTSYVGPLTQTRIGVSSVTVPSMGPMRGHYVFLIPKSRNVYTHTFSIFNYNL